MKQTYTIQNQSAVQRNCDSNPTVVLTSRSYFTGNSSSEVLSNPNEVKPLPVKKARKQSVVTIQSYTKDPELKSNQQLEFSFELTSKIPGEA